MNTPKEKKIDINGSCTELGCGSESSTGSDRGESEAVGGAAGKRSALNLPRLNFPRSKFRLSRDAGGVLIWDALRRVWLRLTPEEWVRQHLIHHLIDTCGAPAAAIRQEYPVLLGGMNQRADVVVFGSRAASLPSVGGEPEPPATAGSTAPHPILLAECKAPEVELTADVFAQAVRYNTVVGARFIVITNGLRHFIHELTPAGAYLALPGFPSLKT